MYMNCFNVHRRDPNVRTGNTVALPVDSNMAITACGIFVIGSVTPRKSP